MQVFHSLKCTFCPEYPLNLLVGDVTWWVSHSVDNISPLQNLSSFHQRLLCCSPPNQDPEVCFLFSRLFSHCNKTDIVIKLLYPQERVFGLVNQVARAHRPRQGWHEESAEEGSWKNWSHFHNHNSEEGNVIIKRPLWIHLTHWTINFEFLTNS